MSRYTARVWLSADWDVSFEGPEGPIPRPGSEAWERLADLAEAEERLADDTEEETP